jgi:hypothetical protein
MPAAGCSRRRRSSPRARAPTGPSPAAVEDHCAASANPWLPAGAAARAPAASASTT